MNCFLNRVLDLYKMVGSHACLHERARILSYVDFSDTSFILTLKLEKCQQVLNILFCSFSIRELKSITIKYSFKDESGASQY